MLIQDTLIFISAKYYIYILIILFILLLVFDTKNRKKMFYYFVITGIIALGLAYLGSMAYDNPRPFIAENVASLFYHDDDNGFPSNHALLAFSISFTVLFSRSKFSKINGYLFLAVAFIIGIARVLANVHHTIDIIGSFVFALIGVLVANYFLKN